MLFESAFNMEVCQLYNFVTHSFIFKINVLYSKDAVVMVGDIFCFKQTTFKISMFVSVYYHTGLMIKTPLARLPVCERKLAKLVL